MLPDEVIKLLKKHKFVTTATSSLKARPNAAPKFFLEIDDDHIYLADFYVNRTWKNLNVNSRVVLSLFDDTTLKGYQIRGSGKVLHAGEEYGKLKTLLDEKIHSLSVDRVIEAVRSGVRSEGYEISMPARIVILKVKVNEISIIGISGKVRREEIGKLKMVVDDHILDTEIPTKTIPLLVPATLKNVYEDLTTVSSEEVEKMKKDHINEN